LNFAYADSPYLGCCSLYGHRHEEPFGCWDDPETHRALIRKLRDEFPDGWAMSCSMPSLETLQHLCREDLGANQTRIASWGKPFAIFKPGVNPGYTWEPVIWRGGRRYDRYDPTVRDFHLESITLKKGLTGAKPPKFADWIMALLGVDFSAGDTITDLFPGTQGLSRIWNERQARAHRLQSQIKEAAHAA
jgi:hypothetical protein